MDWQQERDVFSCDYNGWADVPEEEREAIDAFEWGHCSAESSVPMILLLQSTQIPLQHAPELRAA